MAAEQLGSDQDPTELTSCIEEGSAVKRTGSKSAGEDVRAAHVAKAHKLRLSGLLLLLASALTPLALVRRMLSDQGPLLGDHLGERLGLFRGDRLLWSSGSLRLQLLLHAIGLGLSLSLLLAPHRALVGFAAVRTRIVRAQQVLWIVLVCSIFMAVGPMLTVLNKDLLQAGFSYPLTLSSQGLLCATLLTQLAARGGWLTLRQETREYLEATGLLRVVLPIGVAKAITLACGNAVYLHMGLGFIQMMKAFCPAIVVAVMRLLNVERPTRVTLGFVSLIVLGGLMLVRGELHLSLIGVGLMLASETCEAFSLVLTQKLLQNRSFTTTESLYLLSPVGSLFLLLVAAVLEWPAMIEAGGYRMLTQFPARFLAAAVLGLFVNFVGFEVVKATSSLTVKVLNVFRCIGLVVFGVLSYGEVVTTSELLGYSISLLGFLGYNWSKMDPQGSERLETSAARVAERCVCCGPGEPKVEDVVVATRQGA